MLNDGSDLLIFCDIMEVLREFFLKIISQTYLRSLIKIEKYHNNKTKIMKIEVKSS